MRTPSRSIVLASILAPVAFVAWVPSCLGASSRPPLVEELKRFGGDVKRLQSELKRLKALREKYLRGLEGAPKGRLQGLEAELKRLEEKLKRLKAVLGERR